MLFRAGWGAFSPRLADVSAVLPGVLAWCPWGAVPRGMW